MVNKYLKPSHAVTCVAPSGGVVNRAPLLIDSLFVIPAATAAEGVSFEGHTVGEWEMDKAAVTITAGEKAYWDDTAKLVTDVSTNNTLIGAFTAAAGSGVATARVRLNGTSV